MIEKLKHQDKAIESAFIQLFCKKHGCKFKGYIEMAICKTLQIENKHKVSFYIPYEAIKLDLIHHVDNEIMFKWLLDDFQTKTYKDYLIDLEII